MKLLTNIRASLSITKIVFLGIVYCFTSVVYSYDMFNECFSDEYDFVCKDPDSFFRKMGIDIEKNIVQLDNLHKTDRTKMGFNKGSFYADKKDTEYFVKKCRILNEFMGAKLIHLFLDKNTPVVKVVEDKKLATASVKIPQFTRQKDLKDSSINVKKHTVRDEVRLQVAMDFIAVIDRNEKNMGFISKDSDTLLSARVDYDTSFHFGKRRFKGENIKCDHLNLYLLKDTIKNYPKDQIVDALQNVINVSDKEIMMTVLECWLTLQYVGLDLPIETGFTFGKQMIERKHAFHEVYKGLTSNLSIKKSLAKATETKKDKKKDKDKVREPSKELKAAGSSGTKEVKIKQSEQISTVDKPNKKTRKTITKSK